ncbi:MAG: hypothetical protein E7645_03565 [Ruminococcaceae bacterium]|nr:hypothetical protein [Oscillospiraceae bacterium]
MTFVDFEQRLTDEVVTPMQEYLKLCLSDGGEADFSEKHIEKCAELVRTYGKTLSQLSDSQGAARDKKIMAAVKKLILALNKLNEKTDYAMLETDERENICALVQDFAVACGLTDIPEDGDVTGEWREF